MKKTFKFLCAVALTILICTAAVCANAECSRHPNASVTFSNSMDYYVENASQHLACRVSSPHCAICGDYAGTGADIMDEWFENHTFRNGTCTKCGYSTGNSQPSNSQPSGSHQNSGSSLADDLQEAAIRLGWDAVGGTLTVERNGNIRAEADQYSDLLGSAYVGDTYQILDYCETSSTTAWYKIRYRNRDAWISASLARAKISGSSTESADESSWLIGRTCTVTVSAGKARRGPGTEYGILEYVHRDEQYTIADCANASDGKLWYQIYVDRNACWVASGIVSTD